MLPVPAARAGPAWLGPCRAPSRLSPLASAGGDEPSRARPRIPGDPRSCGGPRTGLGKVLAAGTPLPAPHSLPPRRRCPWLRRQRRSCRSVPAAPSAPAPHRPQPCSRPASRRTNERGRGSSGGSDPALPSSFLPCPVHPLIHRARFIVPGPSLVHLPGPSCPVHRAPSIPWFICPVHPFSVHPSPVRPAGSSALCRFLCPVHPLPVYVVPVYLFLGDACQSFPALPFPSRRILSQFTPTPFILPRSSVPGQCPLPAPSLPVHPFPVHSFPVHPCPLHPCLMAPVQRSPPSAPAVLTDSPFPSQFPTNSSRTRRGSTRSGSSGGSGQHSPARS